MDSTKLVNLLEAALAEARQASPSVNVPEGFVAVVPTGPEGRGKVSIYPEPIPYNEAANTGDLNAWSYVGRISQMTNPATGQPYYPPDQTGAFGMLSGAALDFIPRHSHATLADYVLHPRDWWPQWMIDNDAGRPSGQFSPRAR